MTTTKKKTILVPVDFSEQSIIALGQSYNLAKEYNAEIVLAHVVEQPNSFVKFFSKEQDKEIEDKIRANLKKLAFEVERKSKVKTSIRVPHGKVYEEIVKLAETLPAIFVIMGHDSKPKKKKTSGFIGSNALRVVRESKIPVISIKGKHHRNGCKNIVLPIDMTKESKEKVSKAIELAKLFGGSAIRVVSILKTRDKSTVDSLKAQAVQVKSFIEKRGIKCTTELINKGEKSIADSVVDYANKVDGDLLMIMTQQEQNFTGLFVGSSAQEIINKSNIPVLSIVPSQKKDVSTGFLNI